MDVEAIPTIIDRLCSGLADDIELAELSRWAVEDEERIELLRGRWPSRQLPVIDKYFCVSRLGEGISGVVYKALDLSDSNPQLVAVKLLRFSSKEEQQRFEDREVEILRRLDAPHVARYRSSGAHGGTCYLVTDLVDGRPLDRYITEELVSLEDKLSLFHRVCGVVSELHDQGVVHRDLKPNHVLVDSEGQPWIVDLGISRVGSEDWSTRIRKAQTELGNIIGTAKYMSPEQASGGVIPIDHRADIWSLGIMLYEIVTEGGYPYDLDTDDLGEENKTLLRRIRTAMPKPPRISDSRYARDLGILISRCLAFDLDQRVSSAKELCCDIERCLARKVIHTKRLPVSYKLQRMGVVLASEWRVGLWAVTVSSVVVFLSVISLLIGVRWRQQDTDFGEATRAILTAGRGLHTSDDVVVVGISDQTVDVVANTSFDESGAPVTRDVRSWRGVHAHLMNRLAECKPLALVWDYYFTSEQAADGEFAEAVWNLYRSGVPVVLAVRGFNSDGSPNLSPSLFDPVADIVFSGVIYARNMVKRDGEFVMALRRGDKTHPALALSTLAAVAHPRCRLAIDWKHPSRELRMVYHPEDSSSEPPEIDPVELTGSYVADSVQIGVQPGDAFAIKTFQLHRPPWWEERTLLYHDLLTMDEQQLEEATKGKVVLIGDLRSPNFLGIGDRHDVRYGAQVIKDVPGCYLLADAIDGLVANRSMASNTQPTGILTKASFSIVLLSSIAGCLLPSTLFRRRKLLPGIRGWLPVVLVIGAVFCLVVLPWVHVRWAVHMAFLGTAFGLSSASSCLIEFTRNRYSYGHTQV